MTQKLKQRKQKHLDRFFLILAQTNRRLNNFHRRCLRQKARLFSLFTLLAILPGVLYSPPSYADDIWISMGSDGYAMLKESHPFLYNNSVSLHIQLEDTTVLQINEVYLPIISQLMHKKFNRCGGFIAHDSLFEAQAYLNYSIANRQLARPQVDYRIDNPQAVAALQGKVYESEISETIQALASFTNRYYTTPSGLEGATWILDKWTGLANNREDMRAEFFQHSWQQPSVILTIEGARNPEEVIVIGAHLDSTVGFTRPGTRAPGADDDASGIATMTAVIRAITETGYRPDKTIKFMGYAAEEVGLRGSKAIAASFKRDGTNVIGVLQLDMTNYKGSANDIYIIEDFTVASQNNFLVDLVNRYQPNLSVGYSRCGYGCSDHAAWFNEGYTTSFPFEAAFNGSNPHIHTRNDTFDKSGNNSDHALKFGRLAAAYVAELAKGGFDDAPPPDDVQANFRFDCTELTCIFDAGVSEGEIEDYAWDFGDGFGSSGEVTSHRYDRAGTYNVTLRVSNSNSSDSKRQAVTVEESAESDIEVSLSSGGFWFWTWVDVDWEGALGSSVDIYRNGSRVTTTTNDGNHRDRTRRGLYRYQVCEAGSTTTCSDEVTINF